MTIRANGSYKENMNKNERKRAFVIFLTALLCNSEFDLRLSGGQKTVVALSLIFAIQKLEPAPFY